MMLVVWHEKPKAIEFPPGSTVREAALMAARSLGFLDAEWRFRAYVKGPKAHEPLTFPPESLISMLPTWNVELYR